MFKVCMCVSLGDYSQMQNSEQQYIAKRGISGIATN